MFPNVRRNLLLQLDGKLPNLALMRLSAFLKQRGEAIEFRRISSPPMLEHGLFDEAGRLCTRASYSNARGRLRNAFDRSIQARS